MKNQLILTTIALFSMALGGLGGIQAQNVVVGDDQVEAIRDEVRETAPHGTWTRHLERTMLYLHGQQTVLDQVDVQDQSLPNPHYTPIPSGEGRLWLNYSHPDFMYNPDYRSANGANDDIEDDPRVTHDPLDASPEDPDFTYRSDPDYKRTHIRNVDPLGLDQATEQVPAVFPLVTSASDNRTSGGLQSDLRIYEVFGHLKASCTSTAGSAPLPDGIGEGAISISARVFQLNWNDVQQTWVRSSSDPRFTVTLVTSDVPDPETGYQTFEGSASNGNPSSETGWQFPEGSKIELELLPSLGGDCDVMFDSVETEDQFYGSSARIEVVADSRRINTWVERGGNFVAALPSAASGVTSNARQFQVQVAHASAWPNLNAFSDLRQGDVDLQERAYTRALLYQDPNRDGDNSRSHIENDHQSWMRIRGLDQGQDHVYFDQRVYDDDDVGVFPLIQPVGPRREVRALDGTHALNLITYHMHYAQGLPDGRYQIEVFSEQFGISLAPVVTVGLKDFEVAVVGEELHQINQGETTLYRLAVHNLGGDHDVYTTTPVSVPANWQVDVKNTQVGVTPGRSGEVVIEVTPPSTVNTNSTTELEFRTTGQAGAETVAKTTKIRAQIVSGDDGDAGARLLNNPGRLQISPGQTIDIGGLRIHNKAPFHDVYLLKVSFQGGSGWTGQTSPPSRSTLADSEHDFSLRVVAPASAREGGTVMAKVQAFRIGSPTTPAASMDIPVEVILDRAVELRSIVAPGFPMRDDGTSCVTTECAFGLDDEEADTDFDSSAVFRVEVTNPTPVDDEYTVRGRWGGNQDQPNEILGLCNRDGTGNPDWWRLSWGPASEITGSPDEPNPNSGNRLSGGFMPMPRQSGSEYNLTVPAHTTVYQYLELGWIDPPSSSCRPGFSTSRATNVTYTVRVQSVSDPTIWDTVEVSATIDETEPEDRRRRNDFSNGFHGVRIEADPGQDLQGTASRQLNNTYEPATYRFRVVNEANEEDTLTVDLSQSGLPASWHDSTGIRWINNAAGGQNPSGVVCDVETPRKLYSCDMGIYDEATFELTVKPPNGASLNSLVSSKIRVSSGDDGSKADDITFTTRTIGLFSFAADELKPARTAPAGSHVTLPFSLRNTGTQGDNYEVSIIEGNASWRPRLSSQQNVFVPGQHEQTGFVMVTVPSGAAKDTHEDFRVRVVSAAMDEQQTLDFRVTVDEAGSLSVTGKPSNEVLLKNRGSANTVEVEATATDALNGNVQFEVELGSLPDGWVVADAQISKTVAGGKAVASFQVTPPADALSTSKVPFIVTATLEDGTSASKDIILRLEDEVGVALAPAQDSSVTILPGNQASLLVDVSNLAFGVGSFAMTTTGAPSGWHATVSPVHVELGPLETQQVEVTFLAPDNATAGQQANVALFATSGSVAESTIVSAVVGFTELNMSTPAERYGAPEQDVSFILTVGNNGTIPDQVRMEVELLTTSAQGAVVSVSPQIADLEPNRTADVRVTMRVPANAAPASEIIANVTATSLLNPLNSPVVAERQLTLHVLDYVAKDIDGDGLIEFAVDRDRNASNGFEETREARAPGGKQSQPVDMERFLSASGRQAHTVVIKDDEGEEHEVLRYVIDGDGDGKTDHFLDTTGDGLPNIYWDPDRSVGNASHSMALTIFKDVNADAVLDYFVDIDGDARIDRVFDVRTGIFTRVLELDIDGDGTPDYAVDANGNGQVDGDETVLFTRGGTLVTVLKVDITGDGKVDTVFDTDGDDRVDSFIRSGETTARRIILKDVNGDGILDWTYDSNGDGRPDSYYNPASQTGGHRLDAAETFSALARQYWFVPALFVLVLVLFVALVAVTRR